MDFNGIAPLKRKNTEFPAIPKRGQIKARIFRSLINAAVAGGKKAIQILRQIKARIFQSLNNTGGLNGKNPTFRPIPRRGQIKYHTFQSLINTRFSLIDSGLAGNFAGVGGGSFSSDSDYYS